MDNILIKNLLSAIEKGNVRGCDEIKEINGECYFFQYALKKKSGFYSTYLFYIVESKMDVIEDYGIEQIKKFSDIIDAVNYFKSLGVNIEQFSSIKGNLPF
ncbi:hypothetical protein A9G42_04315 [Gilliamella sp. Nev6-6]|uniref:hypothetical protein n=1 Tax=unclassified Gilliamella TaxID=2685620 RepID=UPI00080F40FC|nr:hypothetical protein [Gilliamella apicola]OCG69558.1 hypothetical protein A9G41_06185 [Gilliamella apicola]OCG78077.1 hypothetical protein A9G42_04315 [Gilliamella apicola]